MMLIAANVHTHTHTHKLSGTQPCEIDLLRTKLLCALSSSARPRTVRLFFPSFLFCVTKKISLTVHGACSVLFCDTWCGELLPIAY